MYLSLCPPAPGSPRVPPSCPSSQETPTLPCPCSQEGTCPILLRQPMGIRPVPSCGAAPGYRCHGMDPQEPQAGPRHLGDAPLLSHHPGCSRTHILARDGVSTGVWRTLFAAEERTARGDPVEGHRITDMEHGATEVGPREWVRGMWYRGQGRGGQEEGLGIDRSMRGYRGEGKKERGWQSNTEGVDVCLAWANLISIPNILAIKS